MASTPAVTRSRYSAHEAGSAILIEARSSVGPISFGTNAVTGFLEASVRDGAILPDPAPASELSVDLASLQSGNRLYDAELMQRLSVRRYPECVIRLRDIVALPDGGRFNVTGDVTLHGLTRPADGAVSAVIQTDGTCLITGQQVFDIRDFDIPTPSLLMLRIFPDVVVYMRLELTPDV